MSLASKTFLVVSDQPETRDWVNGVLRPIVKTLVIANNDSEAVSKVSNQDFDAILLRTSKPTLDEPSRIFQWCKSNKKYVRIPWVVLGVDIEAQNQVVKHNNLKFLPDHKDGAGLIKLLEGVFFSSESVKGNGVDVNFINPFVTAVMSTIETMAQIKLERGLPQVRKSTDSPIARGDISGTIAMNSDRFLGSVALSFEEKLILKIFSAMMGAETKQMNDDVKDSVAELTNIIFGHAKRDLNAVGHTIAPAIPSVITGKNHEIRHSVDGVCIVIPFESAYGRLLLECVIRPNDAK